MNVKQAETFLSFHLNLPVQLTNTLEEVYSNFKTHLCVENPEQSIFSDLITRKSKITLQQR